MRNWARLRFFLLLLIGMPLAVFAQPYERLSVEPSDPGQLSGVGYINEWFVFTADVTGAVKYELRTDDGRIENDIEPDADGKAIVRHRYTEPGRYTAQLYAWRDPNGASIDLAIDVVVKRRPPPPQPEPTTARFSVAKTDPAKHDDVTVPWADFLFSGDVSGAASYELHFGDGQSRQAIAPAEMKTAIRHQYDAAGTYTALLKARSSSGELSENELVVVVQKPAETQPAPQPKVTQPAPITPPPEPEGIPWWILLLAALAIAMGAYLGGAAIAASADPIRFKPHVHLGHARVVGSATVDNAVSMRVRRDAGRTKIVRNEGDEL